MVADGVPNNLPEQGARMRDSLEPLKCFQCAYSNILLEVLIVKRGAGVFCCDVNQGADFHSIKIHVTVLLAVRLYLT